MRSLVVLALVLAAPAFAATKKQKSENTSAPAAQENKAWSGPQKRYYRTTEQAPSSSSHSGHLGVAGCGLGSQVVKDHGKWSQVGAAFLNGTGFQTFAISFGTSNCEEEGMVAKGREKEMFLEANRADVEKELALGSGEYLSSLAGLYGCQTNDIASFENALAKERSNLSGMSAKAFADRVDAIVGTEQSLANCKI